jgi:hypothetical protein
MRLAHRKGLLSLLILLVILSGLTVGAGLLISDWFLDGVVRPRLVRLAAERLQAEVTAGRLVWETGGLTLSDLSVQHPHRYHITLERLRLIPSLRDLLRRRLTSVELVSPDIVIFPGPPSDTPVVIPAELPFTIGALTLRDGRFAYAHPTHPLALHDINFSLRGGAAFDFAFAGRLMADTPIAVEADGAGLWRNGLQLGISSLKWQERSLLREPVRLSLPAGQGGGHLRVALDIGSVTRSDLELWMAAFSFPSPLSANWDFFLNDVSVTADWRTKSLDVGLSMTDGRLHSPGFTLPLASLGLAAQSRDGQWQGTGVFALQGGTTGTVAFKAGSSAPQGTLTLLVDDPVQLQQQLLGRVPLPVAGAAELRAEGRLQDEDLSLSYVLRGKPGRGVPAGAQVDISALTLQGTLEKRKGAWHAVASALLAGKPLASLAGDMRQLRVELAPSPWSRLRRLMVDQSQLPWLLDAQTVAAKAMLTRGEQGWLADATLRAKLVATRQGTLQDVVLAGRVAVLGQRFNLSAGSLRTRIAHDRFGEGALQSRFDARFEQGNWQVRFAELDLGPMDLMSPDGLAGVAGGQIHLQGLVCRAGHKAPLEMRMDGRISATEALWGAWYGELGALPVDVAVFGSWHPEKSWLELIDLKLDVAGLGILRAQGERLADRLTLNGTLKIADLSEAWDGRGRDLVRELRPVLADLSLAGALEASLALTGTAGNWHLQGETRLQNLAADWPRARLTVQGGNGRIPLDLALPANDRPGQPLRRGRLTFDRMVCGPVRLADRSLELTVGTNRVVLDHGLRLTVGGGLVNVEQLQAGYASGGLQLETRILLAGIDLQLLTSELGVVPMEGAVNADLGHIRFADGVLSSDGELRIEAFGGNLRLRNLQLDPFSLGLPQFKGDIEFSGIDLFLLTQTFEFGAVHGVVDGQVHGLQLYGATPSHFSAGLQTRLEGRRNISVKALNNLSILSQGGLSAALSRGVYRFVDFYRYRRIGIQCELAEDVFTLHGTARPDSRRYLVDGGVLPPKIDIVASEQPISFREMLRRLKRIDRTGSRAD